MIFQTVLQGADILAKGETMKIEKKLWITLFAFGMFAIWFFGMDIQSEYGQGKIVLG